MMLCFICKVIDYLCTILADSCTGRRAAAVEAVLIYCLRALTYIIRSTKTWTKVIVP